MTATFDFSLAAALIVGADVTIAAFDVNDNGVWGQFHIKSVVEPLVEGVVAFFGPVAKVIVEAVSAGVAWIWGAIAALLEPAISGLARMVTEYLMAVWTWMLADTLAYANAIWNHSEYDAGASAARMIRAMFGGLLDNLQVVSIAIIAVNLIVLPFVSLIAALLSLVTTFVTDLILGSIASAASGTPQPPNGASEAGTEQGFLWLVTSLGFGPITRTGLGPFGWIVGFTVGMIALNIAFIVLAARMTSQLTGIKILKGNPMFTALGLVLGLVGLLAPLLIHDPLTAFLLRAVLGIIGLIFAYIGLKDPEKGPLFLFNILAFVFPLISLTLAAINYGAPAFRSVPTFTWEADRAAAGGNR